MVGVLVFTSTAVANTVEVPCGHPVATHFHKSRDFKRAAERAWAEERWREKDPRTAKTKRVMRHRRECARNRATRARMDLIVRRERKEFKRHRERKLAERAARNAFGYIDPPGAAYLYRLRMCESGGNYSTDTGNGFYGAYQFMLSTWASVGGSGNPAHASPAEQDYRAAVLWRREGSSPWPVCG